MKAIYIVLALVIALGVAWFVSKQMKIGGATQQLTVTKVEREPAFDVVVAAKDLPQGTLLKSADLEMQRWPESTIRDDYFTENKIKSLEEIAGSVLKSPISKGEPLTPGRIVKPGERSFLSAVLKPGMKAVSIPVNDRTGVSGFVFPGDYVDLILTMTYQQKVNNNQGQSEAVARQTAETIVKNVRVVGIGQMLGKPEAAGTVVPTITLELTPKLAETVTLAIEMGRITVALSALQKPAGHENDTAHEKLMGIKEGAYSLSLDREVSPVAEKLVGANDKNGSSGGGASVSVFRGVGSSSSQISPITATPTLTKGGKTPTTSPITPSTGDDTDTSAPAPESRTKRGL
jgi:pilus assembly protein CpaB